MGAFGSESKAVAPNQDSQQVEPAKRLGALTLAALGVVYGDIGTSPLYALRECFHGEFGIAPTFHNVMGVLSLILWALMVIISIKYLSFVMRADNRGDGGIVALVALLSPTRGSAKGAGLLLALGLFGAAILYGDGLITPAISVLSAIEGLKTADARFAPYVVPISCVILIMLFTLQRRGTGHIGTLFGPFMLLWFAVLGVLGTGALVHEPQVLGAVNPIHALNFFRSNGWSGFRVLGAVFLVVTGGEALYADMGHFGPRPIRRAWFSLVLPALLLNYFGQGALLLREPQRSVNPFYHLAPVWALYPLVVLAACATIIASQAVISGAFSLTRQAINLRQLPRMSIVQTSSEEIGQIYVPAINAMFMAGTLALVIGFRSSDQLAGAYGVGVTTTMVITTVLLFFVTTRLWRWSASAAAAVCAPLLCFDLSFFGANILKIVHGGWFPLTVGLIGFTAMSTWRRGRDLLNMRLEKDVEPMDVFLYHLEENPIVRVPGTAVFVTARTHATPPMLIHHLERSRVLHERVIMITVETLDVPRVPAAERLDLEVLKHGFFRVLARYGFMQNPNIPAVLRLCERFGLQLNLDQATYYLGRETLIPSGRLPGMSLWRKKLFAFMSRNAALATAYYHIPPEQVVEIGIQVEL